MCHSTKRAPSPAAHPLDPDSVLSRRSKMNEKPRSGRMRIMPTTFSLFTTKPHIHNDIRISECSVEYSPYVAIDSFVGVCILNDSHRQRGNTNLGAWSLQLPWSTIRWKVQEVRSQLETILALRANRSFGFSRRPHSHQAPVAGTWIVYRMRVFTANS